MMLPTTTFLGTASPAAASGPRDVKPKAITHAGPSSRAPLRCGSNHRATLLSNSRSHLLGRSIVPDGKKPIQTTSSSTQIRVLQDPKLAGHQGPARPVGPWTVTIKTSKQSYLSKSLGLTIRLVNETGDLSDPIKIDAASGWTESDWTRPSGYTGLVHTGVNIKGPTPLAIVVQQTFADPKDAHEFSNRTYVVSIDFKGANDQSVTFLANSWITADARTFFPGTALLPSETPAPLLKLRQKELNDLKGVGNPKAQETRTFDDRIYEYQEYNDLSLEPEKWPAAKREALGGSKLPYPRRIRTGRPTFKVDGKDTGLETLAPKRPTVSTSLIPQGFLNLAIPWLPMDDDFDNVKTLAFQLSNIAAVLPTFQELPSLLGASKGKVDHFDDVKEILSLYDDPKNVLGQQQGGFLGIVGKAVDKLREQVSKKIRARIMERIAAHEDDDSDLINLLNIALTVFTPKNNTPILSNLFEYPPPLAIANRVDAWRTDEEMGRQFLAGQNPFTLQAITALPANSSITEKDIAPFLEGNTVAKLAEGPKRRLFLVEYYTLLALELDSLNAQTLPGDKRVNHAGHCVLYLRNDGHLVPVAIDLVSKSADKPTVYTPASPPAVWFFAKSIFKTLDSAFHQLVCHWMRTHACMEPYLIATRRNLSVMHPIFKLIMPHFRYTMAINGNARATLVNANGPLEDLFTAAGLIMPLGSKVYEASWRFDQQSLPADLKLRGMLSEDGKLVIDDYPYAQDGLLIWNALEKYFKDYINHYYGSDEAITQDPELQAWWSDILTNGHPDKKEGWPTLKSRADLLQITTTMAWVGAGHHTAVNFGQYDYSGFMPDHASLVTKPMPVPGTPEYKTLEQTKLGKDADKLLFSYLSGKATSVKYYIIVKTLSAHAEDEQYLSDEKATEEWHTDPAAIGLHREFVKEIRQTMTVIDQRNADPALVTRNPKKAGVPYKYLYADSGPGMTSQGVPFSVST